MGDVVASSEIDADTPLIESGFDSIGSAELLNQLEQKAGVGLTAAALFEAPTPRQLARHILHLLDGGTLPAKPLAATADPSARGSHTAAPSPLQRRLVMADEPRLLVLRQGTEDEPLLAMLPGNSGTVLDKVPLARALPAEVWGIEHGYLRFGDEYCPQSTTMEAQAVDYADVITQGCTLVGMTHTRLSLIGTSNGALLAQKVAVELESTDTNKTAPLGMAVCGLVMVDPPPPGRPRVCMREARNPTAVELAKMSLLQVLSVETSAETVAQLHEEFNAVFAGCEDDDEEQASTRTVHELQTRGLDTGLSAENLRRRWKVYRHTQAIYMQQAECPTPARSPLILGLSTGRQAFFESIGDQGVDPRGTDACKYVIGLPRQVRPG